MLLPKSALTITASVLMWIACTEPVKPGERDTAARDPGDTADASGLRFTDGKNFDLRSALSEGKSCVFIFLTPDCPLCQSYVPTISALADTFEAQGFRFYGVFPGEYYTRQEIDSFCMTITGRLKCLTDEQLLFTKQLGATVTPEAFVLDRSGKPMYSGRIDDWMYEIGKKKPAPTTQELKDALIAISQGKPVDVKQTQALGCLIEDEEL